MSADVIEVFAVKDGEGVAFYLDAKLLRLLKRWERWRWDCPESRMRYFHQDRQCFRVHWRKNS